MCGKITSFKISHVLLNTFLSIIEGTMVSESFDYFDQAESIKSKPGQPEDYFKDFLQT